VDTPNRPFIAGIDKGGKIETNLAGLGSLGWPTTARQNWKALR